MKNLNLNRKTTSLLSFVMLVAFAAIALTSCKCDPNAPAPADYRIKTRKVGKDPIETFTYDAQNRVKTDEINGEITTYTYTATQVTIGSGYTYPPLNPQGYLTISTNGSGIYTYDTEGHRIKEVHTNGVIVDFTYDTKGNLVYYSYAGTTYEYLENIDLRVDGMDWYYGKRSTNLVSALKHNGKTISSFQYFFDSRGRVIQMVQNDVFTGNATTTTYTYFN